MVLPGGLPGCPTILPGGPAFLPGGLVVLPSYFAWRFCLVARRFARWPGVLPGGFAQRPIVFFAKLPGNAQRIF